MSRNLQIILTVLGTIAVLRFGIPYLEKRFRRPVWEYPAEVGQATLCRHHRITMWLAYAFCFTAVGCGSSVAQMFLFPGSRVAVYEVVAFCCALMVVGLPALLAGLWTAEVERAMHKRGLPVPAHPDIRELVKRDAKVVGFWLLVAGLSPWIPHVVRLVTGR